MNAQYFAGFTTIILTTGLNQLVLQAEFSHPILTSFSPNNSSLQADWVPPTLPDRGAPRGRRGAATYNVLGTSSLPKKYKFSPVWFQKKYFPLYQLPITK